MPHQIRYTTWTEEVNAPCGKGLHRTVVRHRPLGLPTSPPRPLPDPTYIDELSQNRSIDSVSSLLFVRPNELPLQVRQLTGKLELEAEENEALRAKLRAMDEETEKRLGLGLNCASNGV